MSKPICTASYGLKRCCGADCFAFGSNEDEPCWGDVEVCDDEETTDEDGNPDWYWVHACRGHADKRWDGTYIPEPPSTLCPPHSSNPPSPT